VAIAFDNYITGYRVAYPSPTVTWNHTVSAGTNRLLLFHIGYIAGESNAEAVVDVSFNGVPLVKVADCVQAHPAASRQQIWALVAPPVGEHQFILNLTGNGWTLLFASTSWTGVDQDDPCHLLNTGINHEWHDYPWETQELSVTPLNPKNTEMLFGVMAWLSANGAYTSDVLSDQAVFKVQAMAPSPSSDVYGLHGQSRLSDGGFSNMTWLATSPGVGGIATVLHIHSDAFISCFSDSDGSSSCEVDAAVYLDCAADSDGSSSATLELPETVHMIDASDPQAGDERFTVRSMDWGINQARVIEIDHDIRVDDYDRMWNVGDWFVYNDPDLGVCFVGKIRTRKRKGEDGEGITYVASDVYRTLAKQPARLLCNHTVPDYSNPPATLGTTHVHIRKGTRIDDAIDIITQTVRLVGWNFLPAGVIVDPTVAAILTYKDSDKGGMSIATWIDDILDQTPSAVAYVYWAAGGGGGYINGLKIVDYMTQPDVTLKLGNFERTFTITPQQLLIESFELTETADEKYFRICAEGGGIWERKINWPMQHIYCGEPAHNPDGNSWAFTLRWYFDETNISGWFFDKDGKLQNEVWYWFDAEFFYTNPTPYSAHTIFTGKAIPALDLDNTNACTGEQPNIMKCRWYIELVLIQENLGQPAPPQITNFKGRYTAFKGPLIAYAPANQALLNPALVAEGEFVIQRPELVKFTSPNFYSDQGVMIEQATAIDPTAELQDVADRYWTRYSRRIDWSGSINVHIKDVTGDLLPGSRIVNFGAESNVRVRALKFDFVARSIALECSEQPVRDFMHEKKEERISKQRLYDNWRKGVPAAPQVENLPNVALANRPEGCPCVIVDQFDQAQGGYGVFIPTRPRDTRV
jgi:hypothetical protein